MFDPLSRALALPVVACAGTAPGTAPGTAQQQPSFLSPVEALPGAVVLAGNGDLPDPILRAFVRLAGGGAADIVLVGGREDDVLERRFRAVDPASVHVLRITGRRQLTAERTLVPMLSATGIWLAADVPALREDAVFEALLRSALARGGVVGGAGDGARCLARFRTQDGKPRGFDIMPRAVVDIGFEAGKHDARLRAALQRNPGHVGWGIPDHTALVVDRRRVCAIGKAAVTARVAANDGWPERRADVDPAFYVTRYDELPYTLDLLSWTRSAQARCGPRFPPQTAPAPDVPLGTLVLSGGKGVLDEVFATFIAAAGGKEATFVCIPTGGDGDELDGNSYAARKLHELGCEKVHVLHTRMRGKADSDDELLAPLENAGGVWIDGGRTFRLIDAYQHTKVHALMRAVLRRGGAIGGSSAGCQVQGDFLTRGRPESNAALWWPGYTTGFGFLPGVIIDAHFRQRGREKEFPEVMQAFPQMLGIGVDEWTALIVRGHVAEVVGPEAVTIFDYRSKQEADRRGRVLRAGQRYDLAARTSLR